VSGIRKKKYPGDDEWTGLYLLSLSQQMLRLNAMLTGHHFGSLVNRGKVESVRQQDYMLIKQVYSTVKKSFKQRGINNDELAYHLTAIVCTWPRLGGWLSRNPKSIGRHVRRHRLDNSTK
jgi:hypothetical protein